MIKTISITLKIVKDQKAIKHYSINKMYKTTKMLSSINYIYLRYYKLIDVKHIITE